MDNKLNEQLLQQSSGLFENGRTSPMRILRSPDCMTKSGGAIAEFKSGNEGNEWNDHLIPSESKGSVNNNDTLKPNTMHEIVNNRREHLNTEAQLMFVNSDREGLKVEDHFEEEGDEFD